MNDKELLNQVHASLSELRAAITDLSQELIIDKSNLARVFIKELNNFIKTLAITQDVANYKSDLSVLHNIITDHLVKRPHSFQSIFESVNNPLIVSLYFTWLRDNNPIFSRLIFLSTEIKPYGQGDSVYSRYKEQLHRLQDEVSNLLGGQISITRLDRRDKRQVLYSFQTTSDYITPINVRPSTRLQNFIIEYLTITPLTAE